jgi:hypothetical protein
MNPVTKCALVKTFLDFAIPTGCILGLVIFLFWPAIFGEFYFVVWGYSLLFIFIVGLACYCIYTKVKSMYMANWHKCMREVK